MIKQLSLLLLCLATTLCGFAADKMIRMCRIGGRNYIEQDSIRNFKFRPNKGSIVIDEPNKGDYHFHILPANQ